MNFQYLKVCGIDFTLIYSYKGTINGRDYWVKVGGGDRALWYMGPDYKDWSIGKESDLGENRGYILSSSNLASTCPTNSKNDWEYTNDKWIPTNNVQLNCIGNHNHTKHFKLIAKES